MRLSYITAERLLLFYFSPLIGCIHIATRTLMSQKKSTGADEQMRYMNILPNYRVQRQRWGRWRKLVNLVIYRIRSLCLETLLRKKVQTLPDRQTRQNFLSAKNKKSVQKCSCSCSQVILVYLHPFRRNSLFCSRKSPKITNNPFFRVQGHQWWYHQKARHWCLLW